MLLKEPTHPRAATFRPGPLFGQVRGRVNYFQRPGSIWGQRQLLTLALPSDPRGCRRSSVIRLAPDDCKIMVGLPGRVGLDGARRCGGVR